MGRTMTLGELFENGVSVRKTVWVKRGRDVSKREVEKIALADIHPRTHFVSKTDDAKQPRR